MSHEFTDTKSNPPGAKFSWISRSLGKVIKKASLAMVAIAATASVAHAETLLMPARDYLMGTPEVVWGISTLANGTAFTLSYGDGSANTTGTVADRSFIAFNHTYAVSGTFTVTLTVGAETATVPVQVFNGALLSAADLRGLKINKAIEDGLRLVVADGRRPAKGKRVMPPISKAAGGPMPGVDLADLSALQEIEDLDHVERMRRSK